MLPYCQAVYDPTTLGYMCDAAPGSRSRRLLGEVPAVESNRSLLQTEEAGNGAKRGCLPGAIRPQEHHYFTAADRQVGIPNHWGTAVSGRYMINLEYRCGHDSSFWVLARS